MKTVDELSFSDRTHVHLFVLLDYVVGLINITGSDRLKDVAEALRRKPGNNPGHRFRLDALASYLLDEVQRREEELLLEKDDDIPF